MKVWIVEQKKSNGAWAPVDIGTSHVYAALPHLNPRDADEAMVVLHNYDATRGLNTRVLRVRLYVSARTRRKGTKK